MRKKILALIIVLILVLAGSTTVIAVSVSNYNEAKKQDEALLAQNERALITELFHDQGHVYMTPEEPKQGEMVTLRLRTVRYNVTRAQIQYTTDRGASWKTADMKFEKKDDTGYYDIWVGEIQAEGDLVYYRFTASNRDMFNTVYYDTNGVSTEEGGYYAGFQIVPGHEIADWAKGALWYSIVPDAFYNGDTTNDKQLSGDTSYVTWNRLHQVSNKDRYGGDLDGMEGKLNYIEALGADAIFMNPPFKSYHNVGNRSVHFDEIESSFGNEEDLVELADAVHERDMHIITDMILTFGDTYGYYFNEDGRWPVVGAAQSKESKWFEMFDFFNWPDHYLTTWEEPALDLNSEEAKKLLYTEQDSYLRKYAKIFDGYRFDCGGWLWGKTETDELTAYEVIKDIKTELRKVDEDFLVMAEADYVNLNTNTWDSDFNISYQPKLQDYAKGLINETLMIEAMLKNNLQQPRNVALARYNPICYHDTQRVSQNDDYMYNAAALIQMTFIGSPSIFYGEEINRVQEAEEGVGSTQSFYSMEWDESNWDYERLNFYKATGELRQEFSCIKTGVVNILGYDNATNTITFGRWDENGAAITVTSQNEDIITVEIPVKECDVVDGTIMTDWYTGKQYKVKDGIIKADVIPGGTVFVTGKKSSTYRQGFEQTEIGNSRKNEITVVDAVSFTAEGNGTITKKKDAITFVNNVAHNDFSVFANLRGNGKGTLMIRSDYEADGLYYAAMSDGDKLNILARTEQGDEAKVLTSVDCTNNTYVKIERLADNTFCAYVTEVSNGNLGQWKEAKDSKIAINMGNQVYYGFAALKKETKINNLTFKQSGKESTFDDFNQTVSTSLFDNINADFVTVGDGKLTITNNKKAKLHYLLANSMEEDWTFKAKLTYQSADDEYAGVICQQDENNAIVAGRSVLDGKKVLFIGKVVNGSLAIYDYVEDPIPKGDIIVQLQRVGAYYSAVYSADEEATWNMIGKLYTNFAKERVGIVVSGDTKATFDWVSFGDSIHDGVSTNTPQSPEIINTTYNNDSVSDECHYEYLSGDWSVVTGGWYQASAKDFAQAAATNKVFAGLSTEVTVQVKKGDGYAGLAFGKTTPESDEKDGFVLKYYKNGKVILTENGQQIGTCKLDVTDSEAMKFVIEAEDGKIIVYADQQAKEIITVYDTSYQKGYVSFCTNDASAEFTNFHHGSTNASWNEVSGTLTGVKNNLEIKSTYYETRPIHGIGTLIGSSFTNFVTTAEIYVKQFNEKLDYSAGLLLCASEGKSALTDGVYVHMDGEGRLVISVEGIEKAEYSLPKNTTWANIMVVKQGGTYQVFLKDVEEPVLEYTEEFNRGGVLSIYTINGEASFANVNIANMQPEQAYQDVQLAQEWLNYEKTFEDNFNSEKSMGNYDSYSETEGTFAVQEGVLTCQDATGFGGGVTVTEDVYSDFTLDFNLRIDKKASGWMSVGLRKGFVGADHMQAGVSLMINSEGHVFFWSSDTLKEESKATIPNFKIGEWYKVRVVAKDSNITVYVNGSKITSYKDTTFYGGYISFASGMHAFAVDDLRIKATK